MLSGVFCSVAPLVSYNFFVHFCPPARGVVALRDRGSVPAYLPCSNGRRHLAQQHCSCAAFCTPEDIEIPPSPNDNMLHNQCHHCIISADTIPTSAADLPPLSAPKCVGLQQGTTAHPQQQDPQELKGVKGCLVGPTAVPGMLMGNLGQICCILPISISKYFLGKSEKHRYKLHIMFGKKKKNKTRKQQPNKKQHTHTHTQKK